MPTIRLERISAGFSCLAAFVTLAACSPTYSWHKPGLAPSTASRQFDIDSAECTAMAMQAVPIPAASQFPSSPANPPSNFALNGAVTTYDTNGQIRTGYYHGTAMGAPRFTNLSVAFAQGQAAAQMSRDNAERNHTYDARDKLAEACLLKRGWEKSPSRG